VLDTRSLEVVEGQAQLLSRLDALAGPPQRRAVVKTCARFAPLVRRVRKHRPSPHIDSKAEVAALMAAARALRPALRAATMQTLIGLLACTGLRDGEAFALDRADIDRANGLLRIRDSRFGKSPRGSHPRLHAGAAGRVSRAPR
jgi:integrase